MKFNKMLLSGTKFKSVTFHINKRKYMLASGWSLSKGDWWYREKPEKRKFFSIEKHEYEKIYSYGMYIGRLGLCLMIDKVIKGDERHEL